MYGASIFCQGLGNTSVASSGTTTIAKTIAE
jgi:hypothetical protein